MSQDAEKPDGKSATQTIREGLAAMKSCIQSGEPWTNEMEEKAFRPALEAAGALVEDGWRNCVGYLSDGPGKHEYVAGVPERTGASALWHEFTHARQLGLTGKEPDTRVQMLDRFAPLESMVIAEVHRMMNEREKHDMVDAHAVTRLVVQSLLYGPMAALGKG